MSPGFTMMVFIAEGNGGSSASAASTATGTNANDGGVENVKKNAVWPVSFLDVPYRYAASSSSSSSPSSSPSSRSTELEWDWNGNNPLRSTIDGIQRFFAKERQLTERTLKKKQRETLRQMEAVQAQ